MKYTYPAIFEPAEEGGYNIDFPDIPRCFTCGDDLAHAVYMAKDVLAMVLTGLEDDNEPIPDPSAQDTLSFEHPAFVALIKADTGDYRQKLDDAASVKQQAFQIFDWLGEREQNLVFELIKNLAPEDALGVEI